MRWSRQERIRRIFRIMGCCGFVMLLWTGMASAAEGAPSMWPDFWQRVLNFGIMAAVLIFLFKKLNLKDFFTKRTEKIANTLNDLELKKKEAEKTYEEYKKKLSELDKETERILVEYTELGEKERAKIIANAEKAAAEIREQAEIAIQQELQSAKAELQREIADLSVTAAEAVLKEKMGKEDQQKLVDEFMTKVVEAK
ncbi:MAG: ATP synthase F0 subunit B [Deltaproteobacteria bacterium]|nr:MAG: ATP synthase F0 subunit B [Deltaproteobacteria bacterium]